MILLTVFELQLQGRLLLIGVVDQLSIGVLLCVVIVIEVEGELMLILHSEGRDERIICWSVQVLPFYQRVFLCILVRLKWNGELYVNFPV